ncbi:aromatic-ring opening dioxygenase LigAB LigA subunit [Novosphingobium sp. PhB165]|uniref:hypothetical protein n=1 Tax=Novosphingobium sp. PhB165 TaxID=2485105 RepID=UPI001049ECA2|nr:hypothetical protein [Novosphingobium sp. PhB165]TCM17152.1 aromatic-ring opening dioxygenase LigAB LigA subunit [Novosphingobium sp. PhB165]
MHEQLADAERIERSFTGMLGRSTKAYRLNRALHALVAPAARAAFQTYEQAALTTSKLTKEEQDLARRRDRRGPIHHGAILLAPEELVAVSRLSNLRICASMRRETLEDSMKTRDQQRTYSVAAPARDG